MSGSLSRAANTMRSRGARALAHASQVQAQPVQGAPQLVGGIVPVTPDGRVLLGKREVPPAGSFGTPQGFIELHERLIDGAIREASEETNARVRIRSLLAIFQLPAVTQVQAIYLGELLNEQDVFPGFHFSPAFMRRRHETSEVKLVPLREVDRSELAFPTVSWAIDRTIEVLNSGHDPGAFPPLQRSKVVNDNGEPSFVDDIVGL